MKQIIQDLKDGITILEEVPAPTVRSGHLLIETTKSLVSLGTERMLVEFGKSNLFQKAKQQPDKVKEVINKVKTDGLKPTINAVLNKLGQPLPLGYCNVGRVIAIGKGVEGFSILGNLSGRLLFFSEGIEADHSSLARLALFGKALEIIAVSPILGIGIGGFSKAIGLEDGRLSPYNIFLELWVEAGILPLIVLISLIVFLTVKYCKLLKVFPVDTGRSIISICLYMFLGLLVSSYLEDLRLTYFWLGVSISYFTLLFKEKKYVWN